MEDLRHSLIFRKVPLSNFTQNLACTHEFCELILIYFNFLKALVKYGRKLCLYWILSAENSPSNAAKGFLIIVFPSPTVPSPPPTLVCPLILHIRATGLENSSQRRVNRTEKELENKLKQLTRKQNRTNSSAMKYKEVSDMNKPQKMEQMKSTGNENLSTQEHVFLPGIE